MASEQSVGGAFVGPFLIGGFFAGVGLALGLGLDAISPPDPGEDGLLHFFVPAIWFFVVGGALWGLWSAILQSRENARVQADRADAERLSATNAEKAERAAIQELENNLGTQIPRAIVVEYDAAVRELEGVQSLISDAHSYFESRVFTPFWESVEAGVMSLNRYRLHVESLSRRFDEYHSARSTLASKDSAAAAVFAESAEELQLIARVPAGERYAGELREIALLAQSDYEFASIYEQRRTTQAVVEGFNTLGEAVANMGRSISSAVSGMSSALQEIEVQNRKMVASSERLVTSTDSVAESVRKSNEAVPTFFPNHTVGGQLVEINRRLERMGR